VNLVTSICSLPGEGGTLSEVFIFRYKMLKSIASGEDLNLYAENFCFYLSHSYSI